MSASAAAVGQAGGAVLGALATAPEAALVAASVPQAPLSALFLTALVYSFGGWLWESTVCAMLDQGRFTNSGFLLGPICPIYGTGALVCWLLLRGIESPLVQFLVAGVVCCLVEYLVGLALELATGARFWDYSDLPCNLQGRVCLYGFVLFGAASLFVCRVSEPWLLALMAPVPGLAIAGVAFLLAALLVLDLLFAMASWRRLSSRLEELRAQAALKLNDSLGEASDRMLERLPEGAVETVSDAVDRTRELSSEVLGRLDPARIGSALESARRAAPAPPSPREASQWLADAAEGLVARLGRRDLRFFNAFPQLRIPRYEGVISATHLKERVRDLFGRRG